MDQFQQIVADRHQYAKEWKEKTGRKVIGYLCTYVPEEVIYATGALPVRILGGHQPQDLTEPHIYNMYCSLCRDCLAQGLKGNYDYLDGLVFAFSCIHMCQTFDSWQRHIPLAFSYVMHMPANVITPHAIPYFADEVRRFKEAMEGWSGSAISDEALRQAIATYNTNRSLLRQLYELRRQDNPPLSGTEMLSVVLSSMLMDKAEHSLYLRELLAQAARRNGSKAGVRVLTFGSENDDVGLIGLIEELGGQVVTDDQCAGSRYFWNEVNPGPDLVQAIAERYVERPPCPQKDLQGKRRVPHLLSLAQDYRVQGAILIQQKFCDPHAYDAPVILQALKEQGIPTLSLEYDIIVPLGQYRTRIEAFLEMLSVGEM